MMRDYGRITSIINQKKDKRIRLSLVIKILIGFVFLGLSSIFVMNFLSYNFENIAITSYKTIKDYIPTQAILIRDEKVTVASQGGKINLYKKEGEKIKSGNRIAIIKNNNKIDNLYNYNAGIISYEIDGLESTLRVDKLNKLNYKKFMTVKGKSVPVSSGTKINLGRPVFKIIDNFKFYMGVLLPPKELKKYEVGESVEILFSELEGEYFKGKITDIIIDKPQNIMILEVNRFIPEIIKLRRTNVEIIRRRYHGIVVPKVALIKKGDKVEVLIKGYTKKYNKEVKVLGETEEEAVISGVGPGVKVILN